MTFKIGDRVTFNWDDDTVVVGTITAHPYRDQAEWNEHTRRWGVRDGDVYYEVAEAHLRLADAPPQLGNFVGKIDAYMVTLHVWVDGAKTEEDAVKAVNRMVDASSDVKNNGTVDIDSVVPWDYDG